MPKDLSRESQVWEVLFETLSSQPRSAQNEFLEKAVNERLGYGTHIDKTDSSELEDAVLELSTYAQRDILRALLDAGVRCYKYKVVGEDCVLPAAESVNDQRVNELVLRALKHMSLEQIEAVLTPYAYPSSFPLTV